ncbi:efflux RND transporter periplasmic adaptor subunit [Arenimonas sp.]|uniref:efflux RND transporter periplasmic adaptor subunit n=1 Tax=Arenimonas sp. TaxID=1872635 RepID=UPI0025BF5E3D|nr:efflux RND transporter periplasmic adaptor subunit [Arenimonas sp.]
MARLTILLLLAATLCSAPAFAAVPVRVVVPGAATFGEQFQLTGTLTADRAAALSPRVDGLVRETRVDAGARVKQGQVLVQLDDAVARHALARSRAQSAEAAASAAEAGRLLAEGRRLAADKFIPSSQVGTLEARLQQAQAALASARAAEREQQELVNRHAIPAPFAGVVAARHAEPGEWVQRGDNVLDLVATDRVRLDVQVPQERYAALAGEAKVEVMPDALDGVALPARIEARVPVTDPTARTFLLRLRVDDPDGRLLPGTSARARVSLPATEPALAVPRDALLRQPDGGYSLFVALQEGDGWIARQRTVKVLRDRGSLVAIAEGLEAGERVVVRGNEALRDGQPVRPEGQ